MNISLKEKIHHWFNFLRLAHESDDPEVIANLKKNCQMYAAWGDYRSTSFTKWWKDHSKLFRSVHVIREMTIHDLPDDTALFLAIPYIYAPTTVAKMVQEIYQRQQHKRRVLEGKVKKVYGGQFALTTEDFQASQFHYYYRFANDVYLPLNTDGGKPTTKNYVDRAMKVFAKQKLVTSWEDDALARRKVPFSDPNAPYSNRSKLARNYVTMIRKILLNVSLGEFPGNYQVEAVKNQAEKRKVSPKFPDRGPKRGVSPKRYQEVKKRVDPLDPYY